MSISSIPRVTLSGDEIAKIAERMGLSNAHCKRCGRDPEIAHDRAFCPAFGEPREAGQWLPFSSILRALRKFVRNGHLNTLESCRIEEHDGPAGTWHYVIGLAHNNRYIGRFDAPNMPEFGLFERSIDAYDADYGSRAVESPHNMLYKGWRCALREACDKLRIPFDAVARELGVSPDRSTEEILRGMSGYL